MSSHREDLDLHERHTAIAKRFIDGISGVSSPAVSPDGSRVACVVSTVELAANTTRSRLWLDGAPLTAGEHDGNPTWSPDGSALAFTSRRGEKDHESTLHIVPMGGGEVRTVCTMADGVKSVQWSPDGRWLAFLSRTRDERYEAKDVSWQAPREVSRFFSRLNGEDWIFDRPSHVYVVAADGTGAPRNLTPGEFQHHGLAWRSDSAGLIVNAQRADDWDLSLASGLYAVPLATETGSDLAGDGIEALTSNDSVLMQPSVSPDGTRVAFIGDGELATYPQNTRIGVLPIDAREATEHDIEWISIGLDRTFFPTTGTPAPVWEDDGHVLALAEDRGATHLYRLDASGAFAPEQVTEGDLTVTGVSAASGTIAMTRESATSTSELFVGDEPHTDVGRDFVGRLRQWERFAAPTTDGTADIDAWIMRPVDFDPDRTYPVLLNVHGGPFTQYGEYLFDEAQMQAAAGFVVVLGNPRGGSGRDTAWGQAILGPKHPLHPGSGWGSVDVDDVLAILETALDRYSFCDRDRVGMLGGSYGGFMATWLAAHHGDRFRGICSERSVNNLLSEEWSSDIGTLFRIEHGPTHIEDPDEYTRMSPSTQAHKITTPMLIIHSEEDYRCPINQAEELWMALRMLGREVDFYRFPGENHELSRTGSPVHRVQRAEIILDWFSEKLAPRP